MYQEKFSVLFRKYALPQMAGLLLNSVYLIVDGVFIGNRLGRDAMAAAAISVPVIEILIAISLAISSGAGVLISQHLGRGEKERANQCFNQSLILLGVTGALIAVLGNLYFHPLAVFFGATPEIHGETIAYLRYIISFSPFLMFSFLLSGLVKNDDRPKLAMVSLAVGAASNIILDYVFLYPLDMGIGGAALATGIGPVLTVLILLPHFLRKKGNLFISRAVLRLREGWQLLKLGFPAFIMEFSIGIVTFIYNYAIIKNGYGGLGLAAYLIIGYISLMILTTFLGLAQGLQPIFAYYQGTGEKRRGRELLAYSTKLILAAGVLGFGAVLLFSRSFTAIFAPDDLELVQFTAERCLPYFCGFLFAGYNILMISYWQAEKSTSPALFGALLRSLLLLPIFILALPVLFGSEAIWTAHSLTEAGTAAILLSWLRTQDGKRAQTGQKAESTL